MSPKRGITWRNYPIRTCMYLHYCKLCHKDIVAGETYFDGGYPRRAHVECVEAKEAAARSRKEYREAKERDGESK